jgi:hypothetical protein
MDVYQEFLPDCLAPTSVYLRSSRRQISIGRSVIDKQAYAY